MKDGRCKFWQEYHSVNGWVCFCELAAYDRPCTERDLAAIGCTVHRRQECLRLMVAQVGYGIIPDPKPAATRPEVTDAVSKKRPPSWKDERDPNQIDVYL